MIVLHQRKLVMFGFMKKERTEEEKAEKERKKSEKRERKKSSKREKLSTDELERLEEVRRSLKMKGVTRRSREQDFSDEVDRASVVGLRYSQFYLDPGAGDVTSPDSSDTTSTWSSTSLNTRPRSILKSKQPGSSVSESSSRLDLDDEHLLMKNTQQNEIISYAKSPGVSTDHDQEYSYHSNSQIDLSYFDTSPGECLGLKSKKLLSNFPLQLPDLVQIPRDSSKVIPRTLSANSLLKVEYFHLIFKQRRILSLAR